ncbi:MAG TPA: ATP-binding protein [Polyangiaceae bacterium]|nr:ATP-binding protein [Polyangiaceae bacterium]
MKLEPSSTPTPTPAPAVASDTREIGSGPVRRGSEQPGADPWRDVLLDLSLELPLDANPRELADRFLDGLGVLLPHVALGACIVTEPGEPPTLCVRLPPGASDAMERDPTRLFPLLREERILPLDEASTFHVAANGPLAPLDLQITERSAQVLGKALARSRAYRASERSSRSLERLQARMIQAEKLASLGQIVAGIVHELNNPLTSILAYADYLARKRRARSGDADVDDDLERLRRIEEAASRILKFSRDLVAYSRPSAEVPGPVLLGEVVGKALGFCEHEFKRIRVEHAVADDLPPIRGVSGSLIQVFVNLFTNAAHAMTDGGRLRIRARLEPIARAVLVDVEDEGLGIDPENVSLIFEPFFTTKTEGRGTGLGLSIVRGIVDTHGGTIAVRSAPGQGTIFTLTLPLAGS